MGINFNLLQEWLDSLPDPQTPYEKFVCWISDLVDEIGMRKAERRVRKQQKERGNTMDEKVSIEFTGEEFDEILKYQETLKNATVQSVILNAIRVALYETK